MDLMGLIAIIIVVVIIITVIAAGINILMNEDAKKKAAEEEKNKPTTPDKMNEKDKEAYKKEKQDNKWSDPNEHAKYVIMGGKVECPFCSPTFADIIVTSSKVKLQDKLWATVDDKDGKKNFNFTGVCKHPSQQKPGSPPPPCKAVISLGIWTNFSKTLIDNKNALVVQSTIPCMISGKDLKITDSGQKATLTKIEPDRRESKIHVTLESIDTEYFTPLGIQNPIKKDIETSGYFQIKYKISGEDATSIRFSAFSKYGDLIGFASLAKLEEVVVTGKKTGSKPDKKATHSILLENRIIEEEHLKQGSHIIKWDGFNDEGILNTVDLLGGLRFQISVVGSDGVISVVSSREVMTKRAVSDSKWIDLNIDKSINADTNKPRNIINVNLRVDMKDGGAKGIDEGYDITIAPDGSTVRVSADWEKVPSSEIKNNQPVITNKSSEVRNFNQLETLALEGLAFHWSRNSKHKPKEGDSISIDGSSFEVNVHPENTTKNTMNDDIDLVFNTNKIWARSNNPGCVTGFKSFIANFAQYIPLVPLNETIFYNVGYVINQLEIETLIPWNKEKWTYINGQSKYNSGAYNVDREFAFTAAHEIGHSILRAFSEEVGESTDYSYKHKGSSTYSDTLPTNEGGFNYPNSGEIDLMKYYNGGPYWYDFDRIVAAEEDVKGLIWLTKIKIG